MRQSAGLLVYKKTNAAVYVFLVHPGGPFWKNKDAGAWGIPKGEFVEGEDPLEVAQREFLEETGQTISGKFTALEPIQQKGGKIVFAWAIEGEVDADNIVSNTFKIEWPYKSGHWITVPEVDKGSWFTITDASEKINAAQISFLDQLLKRIDHEKTF